MSRPSRRLAIFPLLLLAAAVSPVAQVPAKIEPSLALRLSRATGDELVDAIVLLAVPHAPPLPPAAAADRQSTLALLRARSDAAGRGVRQQLEQWRARGAAVSMKEIWLADAIRVRAPAAVIESLATRNDVHLLRDDPPRPVFALRTFSAGVEREPGLQTVDAGVEAMQAPRVWSELGLTGRGVLVAVLDSGVCLRHPDISGRIHVNAGEDLDGDRELMDPDDLNGVDDDGNGYIDDLVGWDFDAGDNDPHDELSGHGSHVAGTVAGEGTGGHRAGVAPGAEVLPLRVGTRSSRESTVWEAMQYAAEAGADVISLSLGWAHAWKPDRPTWRALSERLDALGVVLVAAAGNEGSVGPPDAVRTPADIPGVIAVGATDLSGEVAAFSSRGPVSWEGVSGYDDHPWPPGLLKPDVVAPGELTRSHFFCNGYDDRSGTSMATPHVSGTVALMLEADPFLTPAEVRRLLRENALDRGAPGPDAAAGFGFVDAYRVAEAARRPLLAGSAVVEDSAAGNGNGAADPGERLRLRVPLRNVSRMATPPTQARLLAPDGGVVLLEDRTEYPGIAPGEEAIDRAVGFEMIIDAPCGARIPLVLSAERPGSLPSRSRLSVLVGRRQPVLLLDDDMARPAGWRVSGDEEDGAWVRARPHATFDRGRPANPGADAGGDGWAWVTGDGVVEAGEGDLDGGPTVLLSPPLPPLRLADVEISWSRWLYPGGLPVLPPRAWLSAELSTDGGESWQVLETLASEKTPWQPRRVRTPLDPAGRSELLLRFRAGEQSRSGDLIVEAGIDSVRVSGEEVRCSPP